MNRRDRRVVITGLGVATPFGIGVGPFWDALMNRRCGIGPITTFDTSTLPSRIGGQVPPFKPADYVPKAYRKSVKLMSRDIALAVAAAFEACKDAALPTCCMIEKGEAQPPGVDPTRLGANIGAGLICPDLDELAAALVTGTDENGDFCLTKWGAEGMNNLTPLWLLKFLPNMLACHVSIVHDSQALANTITCGEASSHLAIGEAFRNIARGAADVCLCGGAESKMNPMSVTRTALMKRLVSNGLDNPAEACRPFATDRHGTVASEGGGLIILESLEHAKSRSANIYAELVGFASTANARSWSQPDPDGTPAATAIQNALRDAGLAPADVDLAGTFGCGMVDHDAAELNGWKKALGDRAEQLPAIAIKGALGNNGAGSGAIDFCAIVMAMHHNTIPPSLNTQPTEPSCRFKFATADPVDCNVRTAVSLAYALGGGQNAALVIRKYVE